jgi:hypothetical protein
MIFFFKITFTLFFRINYQAINIFATRNFQSIITTNSFCDLTFDKIIILV